MKKSILAMTLLAGALLITSCASKKDLQNCQLENKDLTSNLQNTKEQLAASNSRVSSLEEQVKELRRTNARLQQSLDKSLTNVS